MRLVKRYAIDQVIQRRIVDSRRIAGLVDASAGGRVSAATGLAGPHLRLAEANGVNSRLYCVVLHRVDFAEEEISFPTVGHGRNRCRRARTRLVRWTRDHSLRLRPNAAEAAPHEGSTLQPR